MSRQSRGFGFIGYSSSEEALAAIKKMNNRVMKKRALKVEMSKRGGERPKTPGKYMGRGKPMQ